MIVVDLPLLDREYSYVVYNILNFSIPLLMHLELIVDSRLMTKFEIESEMKTVNKAGTQYILLSHTEAALLCK